jgi:arylsulfatase A-like enzyme
MPSLIVVLGLSVATPPAQSTQFSGHGVLHALEQYASSPPHGLDRIPANRHQTSEDSSCNTFINFLNYNAVDAGSQAADLFFNYSSPDLPGKCCSHCDANASCVAWSLFWNQYSHPPSARCKTFDDLPQPWALSKATPSFECNLTKRAPAPFNPAAGCANLTQSFLSYNVAVSGHKKRRTPETPTPPPVYLKNSSAPKPAYKNILYLVADDFRPQLNSYGHSQMITPNLDKLAATGLQFDLAFCQFAYCAPSRNSFLSGRRPDRTQAINFLSTFRDAPNGSDWVAMPQYFRDHGYMTTSAGKVYHDGQDDAPSWTYPSLHNPWIGCQPGDATYPVRNRDSRYNSTMPMLGNQTHFNPSTQNPACTVTNATLTGNLTGEDVALGMGLYRMQLAHDSGRPWWVSIGVHRPHAPYRAGPGFAALELYPNVSGPVHPEVPKDAPYMSGNWQGEDITAAYGVGSPATTVDPAIAIEIRRYYYAAATWCDHMLGKALDKLDELGVADNTIVVFHGDHGYQLGELNEWSKKTNTELATHVPLLIRAPWMKPSVGKRTAAVVELVDLYRTLADLSGVGLTDVQPGVQGTSLAPLFQDPNAAEAAGGVAYSQIARAACTTYQCWGPTSCSDAWNNSWYDPQGGTRGCNPIPATTPRGPFKCRASNSKHGWSNHTRHGWTGLECGANAGASTPKNQFDFMGYTMRTDDTRFTAWVPWDGARNTTNWSNTSLAYELFNLTGDDGQ